MLHNDMYECDSMILILQYDMKGHGACDVIAVLLSRHERYKMTNIIYESYNMT